MIARILVLSITAMLTGCSDNASGTVPVKGVVLYEGQPLADANVSFIPVQGRPASATTSAAGEFELTTFQPGDGAIPGEYQVTVQKFAPTSGELYAPTKLAVPRKYSELKTTPLRQSIAPEGTTNLRIELQK